MVELVLDVNFQVGEMKNGALGTSFGCWLETKYITFIIFIHFAGFQLAIAGEADITEVQQARQYLATESCQRNNKSFTFQDSQKKS